jgi:hypothetical protein
MKDLALRKYLVDNKVIMAVDVNYTNIIRGTTEQERKFQPLDSRLTEAVKIGKERNWRHYALEEKVEELRIRLETALKLLDIKDKKEFKGLQLGDKQEAFYEIPK